MEEKNKEIEYYMEELKKLNQAHVAQLMEKDETIERYK